MGKPWLIDFLLTSAFLNLPAVSVSLWHQHAIQPTIDGWLSGRENQKVRNEKRICTPQFTIWIPTACTPGRPNKKS